MHSVRAKRSLSALAGTARLGALCLCVGAVLATPARGWEDCSHKTLTSNGIALLNGPEGASWNYYAEFGRYTPVMRDGDVEEDTPKMAVVNHFYDAKTLQKLHTSDESDNNILKAVSLGSVGGVPFSLGSPETPQTTAMARGAYWLKKAALDYGNSRDLAYKELGRALHLMAQDVTQPAHVHNDPHVPYMRLISWALPQGLDGSDLSPLEGKAEKLCKAATPPNFPPGTFVPTLDPLAMFPELSLVDTVAKTSYRTTTFVGTNPFDDTLFGHSGTIKVGGLDAQVSLIIADPSKPTSDCLGTKHFEIDPANPGDPDAPHPNPLCYNPAMKYAGTASSHFSNDWWNINNLPPGDQNVWDPLLGANEFYFHFYNQIFYGSNQQTLNAYLMPVQLELATNYSAAVLKLFANLVDRVPPNLAINLENADGPVIPANGFSREDIYASAVDPVAPNTSGIGYLAIESISATGDVTSGGSVITLPSFGDIPSEQTYTFSGKPEGRYQVHAIDGLGNHSYSTVTVSLAVPDIFLTNGLGAVIQYGESTEETLINGVVTTLTGKAPVKFIDAYKDGIPYRATNFGGTTVFPTSLSAFTMTFDPDSWYWIQACDQALNCRLTVFNTYADPTKAPAPPLPPNAPKGGKQHGPPPPNSPPGTPNPGQPPPPQPPYQKAKIPTNKPPCNPKLANCAPNGPNGPWGPIPKKKFSCTLTPRINCVGFAPHDPNALFGPSGPVTPGQLMTYKVEFENVGGGPAFDVYVKVPLDPALDASAISVRDFLVVNNSSGLPAPIETPTTFPYSYDSVTRTVTLFAGETPPHYGGTFTVEVRLRSDAPQGTVVNQQATVYFPSVLEVTPTNVVTAAVPLPTQLNYAGASTGTYMSSANVAARLAAASNPVAKQPVTFELATDTSTALSDTTGLASASLILSTAAGTYNLNARYPGDNFYYLPSQTNASFSISKKATVLQAPFAVARPTETVRVTLTLADNEGGALLRQSEEPKTVHLELLDAPGGATPLASGVVSGSTASFQFPLPSPLRLSWPIRARFDGDSRYAASVSTGVLNLRDDQAPVIAIRSPHGGETFPPSSTITVDFSISDAADLAPSATAYLVALDGSQILSFAAPGSVSAGSLTPGAWALRVTGQDWASNESTATTPSFQVVSDNMAPRTTLAAGSPSFGTEPLFVSSLTAVYLSATDDRTTAGDGIGIGVAQTLYTIDGGSKTLYAGPFTLAGAGAHAVSYYSVDLAGNTEVSQSRNFFVDDTAPQTALLIDGTTTASSSLVLISSDAIGFSAGDSGAGILETRYAVDGSTLETVYISTFSLATGTHTLVYHSVDQLGNDEGQRAISLAVFAPDQDRPTLALAPPDGSSVTVARAVVAASYADSGRGVNVATLRLSLDGIDITSAAAVTASSAAFVPIADLSQGTHTATAQIDDFAGNRSTAATTFLVDSLTPVTTLLVNGLPAGTTNLVVITTDTIGFSATDAGTGVIDTSYTLDGSTISLVFNSTFSLAGGTHTLSFRSRDRAGNIETPRAASLTVLGEDITPPFLSLTPPNGSTVTTASPQIVALYNDVGRGADAASLRLSLDGIAIATPAFVTVSSAGFTPAAALSQGTHTITASVSDLAGNAASASSTFFIDSLPPQTSLLINGLATGSTNLVLISTDSLGFATTDGGTGVLETRYALDGSTTSLVFNSTFSLAGGTHSLTFSSQDRAGNMEALRTTAVTVLGQDTTPPSLSLTPPNASTVTATSPQIVAAYSDSGRGVDVASVRLYLDGVNVTTLAFVTASSAAFVTSSALAQGTHIATASVSDFAGNSASASEAFFIDSLPPLTTLLVNGLGAGSTNLVLTSTDAVGLAAVDSGVGVLETRYSVDGATETVFVSTFTLSPGGHTLSFHSRDRAGNLEPPQTAPITVTSPSSDTTPPLVRLDFPGTSGLGIEQGIGGVVNVRGAVSDTSSLTWTLEAAPGATATSGFTTIASGAGNLSGFVAAWNTTTLTGYQTLRLRATDAFGNTASVTAGVFVGNPVFNFAIGRKDSNVIVNKIKNPTGIAIRSDGLIWVASTDEDEVILLTSSGTVVAEVDINGGHGHEHEHDDDEGDGTGFKNPQGLAVDAANNLYVADKGNSRIVKLSADGSHILLQIAKLDGHGKPKSGSETGELNKPQDVAVDGNGDIYAADSGNHRIQVFNSSGAFLRQFGPGVLLSTSEVRGIALTAEGLWVSDKEQERVFLFSRAGALIKSIGDADSIVGEISRMRGVVSDRLGALYLVEPNRDRTQKFDMQGKGLLSFGTKAQATAAEKAAKRYLTQPIDAAVAPDGSIWITDTGRDRIVRYVLPTSGYSVAAYSTGGGTSSSGSAEPAKRVVDHSDGAKVERDDGAGVSVPKGALAADLEITVDKGDENLDKEEKTAKRKELKITAVSEEVRYGPEGTTFSAPVTLTLPYDANLIASQGMREDELKVYYWNPTLKDWQAMPSVVDKQNKTVSALTNHFSAYQVGALGGIGVAAIDDFGLRDGYAFPNPSRSGSAVTFRLQPGSVDSIEVRVYDLSGRKIHSSSDFRFLGAIDDGNGKGVQNTYDHTWDVSGVGSGVYTYVMTAKKTGQSEIRKSGKVGVIK